MTVVHKTATRTNAIEVHVKRNLLFKLGTLLRALQRLGKSFWQFTTKLNVGEEFLKSVGLQILQRRFDLLDQRLVPIDLTISQLRMKVLDCAPNLREPDQSLDARIIRGAWRYLRACSLKAAAKDEREAEKRDEEFIRIHILTQLSKLRNLRLYYQP